MRTSRRIPLSVKRSGTAYTVEQSTCCQAVDAKARPLGVAKEANSKPALRPTANQLTVQWVAFQPHERRAVVILQRATRNDGRNRRNKSSCAVISAHDKAPCLFIRSQSHPSGLFCPYLALPCVHCCALSFTFRLIVSPRFPGWLASRLASSDPSAQAPFEVRIEPRAPCSMGHGCRPTPFCHPSGR